MRKVLSLALILTMLMTTLMPSFAMAKENQNIEQELANELKFYFKEVGHMTAEGDYVVTDLSKLKERADAGDEYAGDLYLLYQTRYERGVIDFAKCIAVDYFGVYIDLVNGNLWDAFVGYVEGKAWVEAAKIILKVLGKSLGKANILATAGQLAVAAYNCRGEL